MQSFKPDDSFILTDLLNCQKLLTNSYNNFANHATNETISSEILTLLIEEHQINIELVAEMNKRKLLTTRPANQEVIDELKYSFKTELQ